MNLDEHVVVGNGWYRYGVIELEVLLQTASRAIVMPGFHCCCHFLDG